MKAYILAAALIGFGASSSTNAAIVTIGGSLARSCFEAAEARNATIQSLQLCDRALIEEPLMTDDRVATFVNRGVLRLVTGDFRSADADFDRALALDPSEPEAWLNKGVSTIRQGNSAAAVPMIAKAIELNTRRPALAFYTRGIANENRGDVKAAYADLMRARDLEPEWDLPAKELQRYRVARR